VYKSIDPVKNSVHVPILKHMLNIFLVIKGASNETLRQNADLRMDWTTTIELVYLHWFLVQERLLQLDLDGECKGFKLFF